MPSLDDDDCDNFAAHMDARSDSDSDDDSFFDSDEDEIMAPSSATSTSIDVDESMEMQDSFKRVKFEIQPHEIQPRGRQRITRRLGHAISDPGPIRGRGSRMMPHTSQSTSPARSRDDE